MRAPFALVLTAVTALSLPVLMAAPQAQQRPPQPPASQPRPPQFRSGIDVVQVDVSVLDRNRRPVRGLEQAEFTVLENGKPQPVVAFQAVDMPDELPAATPWMRDVLPDVRRNDEAVEHRLIIVVMDDATMMLYPPFLASAKEIGHRVINMLGPTDLAAVLYTLDNRKSQDFTADRQRLHEAVERFAPGFRTVGLSNADRQAADAIALAESNAFFGAVETLGKASEYLASVPQRRKALVYVSLGVPVDAEMAATPVMAGPGAGAAASLQSMQSRLIDRMKNIFRQAQLANVNIYPVDPAGVGGMELYIQSQAAMGKMLFPYERASTYLDFLVTLAENTGGHAFVNTNEFETGVLQIFRENSSYYLLGYRTPDPSADGKFRKIEVRVSRPGLEVRARSGYYTPKASDIEKIEKKPPSPVAVAMSGLLPKGDVPMQLAVAPFALPSRREVGVAIITAIRQPVEVAAGTRFVEKVDLAVHAYNNDGKVIASQGMRADVVLRPGTSGLVGYELLSRLDLKPGRYQLRFGANVTSLKDTGSVYYDLEVPDFYDTPLSLSGVVFTVSPSVMSAPRDKLKSLIPVVPSAQRDFSHTDRVSAYLQVYQGGKHRPEIVELEVTLLDSTGNGVFHSRQDIGAERFGVRPVEYQLDLPMARLSPGHYLLSIVASTSSAEARRDVRFIVVR